MTIILFLHTLRTKQRFRVSFTTDNKCKFLFHVTKFSPYLLFTVLYNYTEISGFTAVLSIKIVLSCDISAQLFKRWIALSTG